jgi:hypothetical protein
MLKISSLLQICALALSPLSALAELPARFQMEKAITKTQDGQVRDLNRSDRQALERYDFVLVDGILGDLTQSLYSDVEPYLAKQFPQSEIQVLRPSSFLGLEQNADMLARQLRSGSRPRILIAHSRGAAEVFLALLKNPELLAQENLAHVVLIQGAFSGSPVADWTAELLEKGCRDASRSELWTKACDFADLFSASLTGLRPNEARALRLPLQRSSSEATRAQFMKRVSFVRSQVSIGKASLPLKPSALYLGHYFDAFANDGILLTMQQRVPGFGQDLGVLEADHLELLGAGRTKSMTSAVFVRSLMSEISSNE